MNKLTAEEIIKLLTEGLTVDEDSEDYDEDVEPYTPEVFIDQVTHNHRLENETLAQALGEIKFIKSVVDEDDYYTHHNIIHFVDHDVYLSIDAYYNSYEGYVSYEDSDYGYQVFPKEITTTIYEKVQK